MLSVVLEKTPESPLNSKEFKPVNLKRDQPWIFTGGTDAVAEAPIFWSSYVNRTHWKSPSCWERLRVGTEEGVRGWVAGWHHQRNEHELGQTPGDNEEREACWAAVHGVAKSWTWLDAWTATTHTFESGASHLDTVPPEDSFIFMKRQPFSCLYHLHSSWLMP